MSHYLKDTPRHSEPCPIKFELWILRANCTSFRQRVLSCFFVKSMFAIIAIIILMRFYHVMFMLAVRRFSPFTFTVELKCIEMHQAPMSVYVVVFVYLSSVSRSDSHDVGVFSPSELSLTCHACDCRNRLKYMKSYFYNIRMSCSVRPFSFKHEDRGVSSRRPWDPGNKSSNRAAKSRDDTCPLRRSRLAEQLGR